MIWFHTFALAMTFSTPIEIEIEVARARANAATVEVRAIKSPAPSDYENLPESILVPRPLPTPPVVPEPVKAPVVKAPSVTYYTATVDKDGRSWCRYCPAMKTVIDAAIKAGKLDVKVVNTDLQPGVWANGIPAVTWAVTKSRDFPDGIAVLYGVVPIDHILSEIKRTTK